MQDFDDIRPYKDNEVKSVLERLINDNEFIDAISRLRLPNSLGWGVAMARPFVRNRLKNEVKGVETIQAIQDRVEPYLTSQIEKTVARWTVSGLNELDRQKSYLFVSNHRDISMDSAFVNWAIYKAGFSTLRIAIGDNLLTKPFASDLMRLNKSFIVNRSAKAPREKLKAAKLLSKYIFHSVVNDQENVWIAQREGRAKDGNDVSNSAIMGMFGLSREKSVSFSDHIRQLNIVPVSISYEYDPCDQDKARELFYKEQHGNYQKDEHEDVASIAKGITGFKGDVHLSFGPVLSGIYEDADALTSVLDQEIQNHYVLHATNCFAYEFLENHCPEVEIRQEAELFNRIDLSKEREKFKNHVELCPVEYRNVLLQAYANPVYSRLRKLEKNNQTTASVSNG